MCWLVAIPHKRGGLLYCEEDLEWESRLGVSVARIVKPELWAIFMVYHLNYLIDVVLAGKGPTLGLAHGIQVSLTHVPGYLQYTHFGLPFP